MVNTNILNAASSYSSAADTALVTSQAETIIGVLLGMGMTVLAISGIVLIFTIIANWRLFKKAGEEGWKSIIPIYNTITLMKIAGVSPWWILGYFASLIPGIGALVCLGITIYVYAKLAQAFGKGAGFTVGLILLNTIFVMILAFGSSEYQLNRRTEENFNNVNQ